MRTVQIYTVFHYEFIFYKLHTNLARKCTVQIKYLSQTQKSYHITKMRKDRPNAYRTCKLTLKSMITGCDNSLSLFFDSDADCMKLLPQIVNYKTIQRHIIRPPSSARTCMLLRWSQLNPVNRVCNKIGRTIAASYVIP